MSDLPDLGPYTSALIGAWWPAAPDHPTAAITHWSRHSATKQQEAQEFDGLIAALGERNSGRTADDTLARLRLGKKRLLDVADQCRARSEANAGVAGAVHHLRDRLEAIADDGNRRIDEILNGQGSAEAKLPKVNAVIAQANSESTSAGATALDAIADATRQVFGHTDGGAKAREWLQGHGVNFGAYPVQPSGGGCGGIPESGDGVAGTPPLTPSPSSGVLSPPLPPGVPGGPTEPDGTTPRWAQGDVESSDRDDPVAAQVPSSPASTPMAGGPLGRLSPPAGPTPAAPAPPAVTTGPAPVPARPGPAAPSGLLPGYGSDLRPAGAVAPVAPAGLAGPASPGAPAAVAGGTAVAAPRHRSAPAEPGAARPAERKDLRRIVDAVARQAPSLAWAAGLRDDETTTVLVTDLAAGWIPPGVRLPLGVTLLAPARRGRDRSAVDLLGAVTATATHRPGGPVADAGPDAPVPGGGERARHGHRIDELGPALTDAAGDTARLPRIVATVARAVARRSGVDGNEIALFRTVLADAADRVCSAYPRHNGADVADWMLLAAIDALIDGAAELARYHLAWHQAVR